MTPLMSDTYFQFQQESEFPQIVQFVHLFFWETSHLKLFRAAEVASAVHHFQKY